MGPFVAVLMGLAAIVVGLIFIAMRNGVTDAFRASTKATGAPKRLYTPGVVLFTGVLFVLFGVGFVVFAIAYSSLR